MSNKLNELSSKRYKNRRVSDLPLAQQHETEDIKNIITTRNNYVATVPEANEKIKEILDSNFAYIDPDDVTLFIDFFYEHYLRGKAELREHPIPLEVHMEMGDVSFLRPEFIERVEMKFLKKQRKLRSKFKLFD